VAGTRVLARPWGRLLVTLEGWRTPQHTALRAAVRRGALRSAGSGADALCSARMGIGEGHSCHWPPASTQRSLHGPAFEARPTRKHGIVRFSGRRRLGRPVQRHWSGRGTAPPAAIDSESTETQKAAARRCLERKVPVRAGDLDAGSEAGSGEAWAASKAAGVRKDRKAGGGVGGRRFHVDTWLVCGGRKRCRNSRPAELRPSASGSAVTGKFIAPPRFPQSPA